MKTKTKNILTGVFTALTVLSFVLAITLSCVSIKQRHTINNLKQQVTVKEVVIDSLTNINKALSSETCLTVTTNFTIDQKNVLSFSATNAQNISRTITELTRGEVLNALDSLRQKQ